MGLHKMILSTFLAVSALMLPNIVYGQAFGKVKADTLNVREKPNTSSRILQQVGEGTSVEIIEVKDGWFKLRLKDDSIAYVKSEFIDIDRVVANVEVAGGLNVRDYPSTDEGDIIGKFYSGDETGVQYKIGDWYSIRQEGFEGYVHKDYVKQDLLAYLPEKPLAEAKRVTVTQEQVTLPAQVASKKTTTQQKQTITPASGKSGAEVVAYAKQFVGNPYVYGGNSLTNGVDCSGFTQQVMKHFGISISRSSSAQYANNGYAVGKNELQKGDLLFFGYKGRVSHVGIYIGGGQMVHACDERTGIIISDAFSNSKPFIGAKRVL
ncbi:hypothetical protein CS063_00815 [Sporanaerobium hydrogeniformans]|uniref:Uncharacterized protein n=1 Tax=Sporanaerobium hydrogeniformans TaxID=3072179 RepID=A0AC61DHY5_9FIRM|nr:NlpC/P60 family protein [Sporanaerobium hydrogeniformans]PHV72052.1 hypothetical protein CS063_00815 [Sporanaerobium hydrogeniformans]